jgi:cysteine synthase A
MGKIEVTLGIVSGILLYKFYIENKVTIKKLLGIYDERKDRPLSSFIHPDISSLIGNTPLMEIKSLSEATGCRVIAKLEYMNPGGSPKDRVAFRIIKDAERAGKLRKSAEIVSTICEGTVGSTGISLTLLSRALGYNCYICMPDDVADEKKNILRALGATVGLVKPVSIINENMYVNQARKYADSLGEYGFFADQFENMSNFLAHYEETGPEIYSQLGGNIDGVVLGSGTGGTLAGVSRYLKEQNPNIKVCLVDPQGSGLFNKVKYDVMYSHEEAEGTRHCNQVDTIVEGVGINRVTKNFSLALVDEAFKISDKEVVEMSRFLMKKEGLFVGSSSAINCVGVVKLAQKLGPGHTIVTLLCDSGARHLTKFWSEKVVEGQGLTPTASELEFIK